MARAFSHPGQRPNGRAVLPPRSWLRHPAHGEPRHVGNRVWPDRQALVDAPSCRASADGQADLERLRFGLAPSAYRAPTVQCFSRHGDRAILTGGEGQERSAYRRPSSRTRDGCPAPGRYVPPSRLVVEIEVPGIPSGPPAYAVPELSRNGFRKPEVPGFT
jgi:hypothetical protein